MLTVLSHIFIDFWWFNKRWPVTRNTLQQSATTDLHFE